jgi:Tol biopolymer transport system component
MPGFKTTCLLFFLLVVSKSALAQTGSEIYLADLEITGTSIKLSNPKNITNRKGYDNQPSFHPDKPLVYYSSFNEQDRVDIKVFNFRNNKTELFTETPEREYSPTVTPDHKFISCIIQRDDEKQDLGKYPIKGGAPTILINNLTVGYHTWINTHSLALFVLGEPHTLRVFDLQTGKDSIITHGIGRSLHKIPNQNKFSFVDKSSLHWTIKSFGWGQIETITETLSGREDLAWTPDGKIIMSDGRQFFFYDTQIKKWQMFFASDLKSVSRIAVSPDGKKIAFVVSE